LRSSSNDLESLRSLAADETLAQTFEHDAVHAYEAILIRAGAVRQAHSIGELSGVHHARRRAGDTLEAGPPVFQHNARARPT
jgi:hypothetical protein